ncbi:MAG TPA: hypothetical protein VIF62_09805, partial [Labilithrix sp.]
QNVPHDPPPDPFSWPQGARRGDDLGEQMRRPNGKPPPPPTVASGAASSSIPDPNGTSGSSGGGSSGGVMGTGAPGVSEHGRDDRPSSTITIALASGDAHRGAPLHVKGTVASDGEPCAHVTLDVVLKSRTHGEVVLGVLATDDQGGYDGSIVLPLQLPLGDWDVAARTEGDQRCGRGATR